jgi:hypothetical protein
MRSLIVVAGLGSLALFVAGAGVATERQTQRMPGPGSGIVPLSGTVEIGNTPMVKATQQGDWKVTLGSQADVRVTNTPLVSIAAPDFLKKGGRYSITWATGEQESIVVTQAGTGWVRTERDGRVRWVNLASARTIEEAR